MLVFRFIGRPFKRLPGKMQNIALEPPLYERIASIGDNAPDLPMHYRREFWAIADAVEHLERVASLQAKLIESLLGDRKIALGIHLGLLAVIAVLVALLGARS